MMRRSARSGSVDGLGQVGEGDQGLALREGRQRPVRHAQRTEPGDGQAALENAPTTL